MKYTVSDSTLQYKVGLTLSFLSLISRGVGGIQNCNTSINIHAVKRCTVLPGTVIWIVVSYSYVLYSTIPGHVYRIAHMATPAPRCSCCYAQRKSRGPEGHCDGNFLVLLLRDACFRLPHCRPAHSCRPSKEGKALASACGRLHGRPRCPTTA